ncbi:hypothetical protein D3C71_2027930 [compost metagenome]
MNLPLRRSEHNNTSPDVSSKMIVSAMAPDDECATMNATITKKMARVPRFLMCCDPIASEKWPNITP